jgi:hypothetical protein
MGPEQEDTGQFKRIAIPLVRRIYPQLIANKIVSVQPLLGPTGLTYYLRHRYSQNSQSQPQPTTIDGAFENPPTRKKQIKKKKYRSIDDPWSADGS